MNVDNGRFGLSVDETVVRANVVASREIGFENASKLIVPMWTSVVSLMDQGVLVGDEPQMAIRGYISDRVFSGRR